MSGLECGLWAPGYRNKYLYTHRLTTEVAVCREKSHSYCFPLSMESRGQSAVVAQAYNPGICRVGGRQEDQAEFKT